MMIVTIDEGRSMEHPGDEEQAVAIPPMIRPCVESDVPDILTTINAAAVAYRSVIPADRWHDPYMALEELRSEVGAGVKFVGYFPDGVLVGVMGIQQVRNVCLIRHAYVLPHWQGRGAGSKMIAHLRGADEGPALVGTWQAASWAIRFYERQGFELVPQDMIAQLLKAYWNVPARQIETSVVLALPPLSTEGAMRLIAGT